MELTDLTRHITLSDQAADRYPRIPFDLPEGSTSFSVTLRTSAGDDAGIDLGCEGPEGWRGWSGGARSCFAICEDDATPGYLPGRLEPGRWSVVLGLHRIPAEGVDVTVTVESPAALVPDHGPVEDPVPGIVRGSARGLPAPDGLTWYAGDLHAHSLHSDGALSLWELADEAVRSGLDYLACTEHNTVSHHPLLGEVGARQGITLVPGQEVTTHRGHANVYGDVGFVDFRRPASEWVEEARRRGAVMSVNHPVSDDCSWLHRLDRAPDGVELYHGSWYRNLTETSTLAWYQLWRQLHCATSGDGTGRGEVGGADGVGEGRAGTGDPVPGGIILGGGDFHDRSTPLRPGMPTTWIAAEERSPGALLEGLRAGRTTVTGSARMVSDSEARPVLFGVPTLVRQGEDLLAVDAVGTVLVDGRGVRHVVTVPDERVGAPRRYGPFRLELANRWVVALCA